MELWDALMLGASRAVRHRVSTPVSNVAEPTP